MLIALLIFLSLSSGIFARPTVEDQIDFINEDDTNPNVVAYVPEAAEYESVEQNNGFTISQAGTVPVEQAPTGPPPAPGCTTSYPYLMTCGGPEVQVSEETKEILNCVSGKIHGLMDCLLIRLLEFLKTTAKS